MKNFCCFVLLIFCLITSIPAHAKKDYAKYHNEIGFKHQQLGQYEKALSHYLIALEKNPNFFAAQNNAGTVYFILKNYKASIYHYNIAINLNPKCFIAHYSKALAILAILNISDNSETINLRNNSLFELSVTKNNAISLRQAINELKIAESLCKNNINIQLALGIAYYKDKQKEKALNNFNKVLKENPQEPVANFYKGLALHKKGNYNCINYYKKALKSDPYYTKAYIQIAKAFLENNNRLNAYIYIEKGLNIFNCYSNENISNNNLLISRVYKTESPIKYSKYLKSKGNVIYNSTQSQFNEEDKVQLVELSYQIKPF